MRKKIWILFIGLLLCGYMVYASDTTGISEIDTPAGYGKNIIKMIAKWGGIAMIVTGAIMLGNGKLKGEAMSWLAGLICALGLIMAAFGWWDTNFTKGFAF